MTVRMRGGRIVTWAIVAVLGTGSVGLRAQAPPVPLPPEADSAPITASQLNRIRKALDNSPPVNLDEDQLRYYVRILASQPNFSEYLRGYDFRNGPTRR